MQPSSSTAPSYWAVQAVTAIAWTTREDPDVLALVGAHFGMAFEAADAGALGRAITPADPQLIGEAFELGVWATKDGIAVWRAGEESAAAFMRRGRATIATWSTRWILVDPSKPGQTADGSTLAARLNEMTAPENDTAPWIARFRVARSRAPELRALFRRTPRPEVLDELMSILDMPREWLRVLSDAPGTEQLERIEPRTAREMLSAGVNQALADADWRQTVTDAKPAPSTFRSRHPRAWLAISAAGIIALAAFGIVGILDDRATAFIPAAVGLAWVVSLIVDGSFSRVRRSAPHSASAHREDPSADLDPDPA
ncbi:hypothetical protein V2S04_01485 [Microbacterium sp. OR21]|uniref:hypothetical protein n=1 Tax=Microbacterium sp. OR21 TaxID=3095346 RepID=UPI0039B48954